MRRHAVDDRAHGVLAHAEVQVAAGVTPAAAGRALLVVSRRGRWIEVAEALERRVGRRIEVRRTAGERREAAARSAFITLPEATRVAMPLASAGKSGISASQPGGSSPLSAALQLLREVGEGPRVCGHAIVPCRLVARAARHRLAEVRQRRVGDQERRLGRPAELLLGQPHLLDAERRAVRLEGVLLVRRAVADVGAHPDQRRPRRLRARRLQRGVDRRRGRCRRRPHRVPAVRLETPRAILRERDVGAGGERDAIVVVEAGQLAEPQMPGQRGRLRPTPSIRSPSLTSA